MRWAAFGTPRRLGVVIAFALLAALGFVPQLGGPGYEAALVSGLVLPSIAAIVMALVMRSRELGPELARLVRRRRARLVRHGRVRRRLLRGY